ncbi:hypothetical protein PN499_09935 [Kamptonema animale CS-326]|jgi:hypothetical protein|uniref:hypothetical protein n=1 Tax=Kamptonema animale TaxID=92934 RepID=UPI00232E577A|nr:hypothetical protein [Kamptonema animale]MDB9511500.1 hypothetical protein [Kamptonema animale CS-326]
MSESVAHYAIAKTLKIFNLKKFNILSLFSILTLAAAAELSRSAAKIAPGAKPHVWTK